MATVTLIKPLGPAQSQTVHFAGSSLFSKTSFGPYVVDGLGRATVDTRDAPKMIAEGWMYWTPGAGGGTPPTSGVATLQFGAFPGAVMAQTIVSAIDGSDPNAEVDAWIIPVATADHSADEHSADPPMVNAQIVGSTIVLNGYPSGRDKPVPSGTPFGASPSQQPISTQQPMPYGAWSVAWAFSP